MKEAERKIRSVGQEGNYIYCVLHDAHEMKPTGVEIIGYTGSEIIVHIPGRLGGLPVLRIGRAVYKDKTNIVCVFCPSALTAIGVQAFDGCTALEDVYLSSRLERLESRAFGGCRAMRKILIPARTVVSESAFDGCDGLEVLRRIQVGFFENGKTMQIDLGERMFREKRDSLPE